MFKENASNDLRGSSVERELNESKLRFKRLQDELKDEKERYNLTIDKIKSVLYDLNLLSNKIIWAGAVNKLTGFSQKEMSRIDFDAWAKLIHPEDRDKTLKDFQLAIKNRRGYILDYRFKRKNDGYIYVRDRGTIFYNKSGRAYRALGLMLDVTDRRNAEKDLNLAKEKAERYLDTAAVLLVALDINGRITMLNRKGYEILGYKEGELIGKRWFDIVVPKSDRSRVLKAFSSIIKGDVKQVAHYENLVITKKGRLKSISWYNVLLKDENGNIIGTLSSGEDVTEKKKIEEQLKIKNIVFDRSEASNSISDLNGDLVDVNSAFLKITGFSKREELIGRPVSFLFQDKKTAQEVISILRKSGKWSGEIIVKRKDGSNRIAYGSCNSILNESGKIIGYQSSMYDITDKKEIEEALKNSKLQIENISNNLEGGMIYQVVRLNDGSRKFLYLSDKVKEFYGVTPEQAKKDSNLIYSKIFKDDVKRLIDEEEKAYKNLSTFRSEARIVGPNGKIRWSYFVSVPKKMVDGSTHWDGIELDITERKIAEEELKRAKENVENLILKRTAELQKQTSFLSSVLEHVPNMIFVKDAKDLRFELFNKAGEHLLGYKRENMIGKNDYDFFPKKQADFFTAKDRNVLDSKILLDIPEEPIDTKNGKRFLHTKKIPILDEAGKPLYLLGISEDITEKKELLSKVQEQNEKLREKIVELERFSKIAIGRELKMIELKSKIKQLEKKK